MKDLELERFSWISRWAPNVIARVHAGRGRAGGSMKEVEIRAGEKFEEAALWP